MFQKIRLQQPWLLWYKDCSSWCTIRTIQAVLSATPGSGSSPPPSHRWGPLRAGSNVAWWWNSSMARKFCSRSLQWYSTSYTHIETLWQLNKLEMRSQKIGASSIPKISNEFTHVLFFCLITHLDFHRVALVDASCSLSSRQAQLWWCWQHAPEFLHLAGPWDPRESLNQTARLTSNILDETTGKPTSLLWLCRNNWRTQIVAFQRLAATNHRPGYTWIS